MKNFMQFIQKTVEEVEEISPFPLSISDAEGFIIGDSDPERIGTFHEPSSDVLRQDTPQLFPKNKLSGRDNVLPGVALPLYFDSKTNGVLGIIGDPNEVLPYAKLIKRHVEVIWQDVTRTQIEELETSLLETFIRYILLRETTDPQKITYYCELLHIEPALKRYCILIDIGDALLKRVHGKEQLTEVARFRKTLLETVSQSFSKNTSDPVVFLNAEKIILIKSLPPEASYRKQMVDFEQQGQALLQMFHTLNVANVSVAAGGLCNNLENLDTSFQEAKDLIRYGNKFPVSSGVYSFHQWDTLRTLLPHQVDHLFREKLQTRLEPLYQDKQFSELANSFKVYCHNNLNISSASKALYLHRNTLIYRLQKIEKTTGLDLASFSDCMMLYVALANENW